MAVQPLNGIGPRCSANGPSAATGRNKRAPMMTIVPNSKNPNVVVSSRNVPKPNGEDFFAPRLAAMAMGATIGKYRLKIMTKAVAMSHGTNVGDGLGLLIRPPVVPRPSNADPLLAEAEENWYMISENPCGPGLFSALVPQSLAEKNPVGKRIMIG